MKLIFGGKNIAYLRIVQTNRASSSLFLSSFALSFPLSISSLSKGEWPGTSRQGRRLNERGKERADESWSCLTPKRNTAIGLAKKVEKKFSSWRHVVQKLLFLKQYHTCLRCASRSVKFPMNARRRRASRGDNCNIVSLWRSRWHSRPSVQQIYISNALPKSGQGTESRERLGNLWWCPLECNSIVFLSTEIGKPSRKLSSWHATHPWLFQISAATFPSTGSLCVNWHGIAT